MHAQPSAQPHPPAPSPASPSPPTTPPQPPAPSPHPAPCKHVLTAFQKCQQSRGWRGSWSRNLELIILLLSRAQLHLKTAEDSVSCSSKACCT